MREVFGDGRIVATADGFGVEAIGLHVPAQLLASQAGSAVPDLSSEVGKVISYVGLLEAPIGQANAPRIHCAELHLEEGERPTSPAWAVFSGNLGNPAEVNPRGDRITASLAYHSHGEEASWLQLTCYRYFAAADLLSSLEKGAPITVYGALESYVYNDKPRLQLAIRGFQRLRTGDGPEPPTVLFSSRTSADTEAADPFVEAA